MDTDEDGLISPSEVLETLNVMVGASVTEHQLQDIAEHCVRDADTDLDGHISFEEFKEALHKVDVDGKMSIQFLSR